MRGGWIGNSVSADDGLEGKLQDNNFRFSTTKCLTSCEQSLRTIELLDENVRDILARKISL